MAKRVNYAEFVGKDYGKFKVVEYENLNKKHMYLIKFHNTGNEQWINYTKLRKNETITDKKLMKDKAKLKRIKQLKQRNLITKKRTTHQSPRIYQNECVLVLDASTTSTGYCVVNQGNVVRHGTIIPNAKHHLTARMKYIDDKIKELIEIYKVEKIIIEDIYLGLNSNVLVILAELRGVIKTCWLPMLNVRAIDWKKYHNVEKRNDRGKSSSMDITIAKGYRISTDDESDAILMALYCLRNEKNIWHTLENSVLLSRIRNKGGDTNVWKIEGI